MNASLLPIPSTRSRDAIATPIAGSSRPARAPAAEPFAKRLARSRGEPAGESADKTDAVTTSRDPQARVGRDGRDGATESTSITTDASVSSPPADAGDASSRPDETDGERPSTSNAEQSETATPIAAAAPTVGESATAVTGDATPVELGDEWLPGTLGSVPAETGERETTAAAPGPRTSNVPSQASSGPADAGLLVPLNPDDGEGIASSTAADRGDAALPGQAATGPADDAATPNPAEKTSSSRTTAAVGGGLVSSASGVDLDSEPGDADADQPDIASGKTGEAVADQAGKTMARLSSLDPGSHDGSTPPVGSAASANATRTASSAMSPAHATAWPAASVSHDDELARQNIDRIVGGVRGELLPRGGSMQIRLDPPQLGSLQVSVRVQDGVLSASFQTTSEQATQLLSQSMTQLKSALESSGMSVERLHVQQAPASRSSDDARGGGDGRQQHGTGEQQSWAQGEQQRREMLQRMWRRLGLAGDPLDLVA